MSVFFIFAENEPMIVIVGKNQPLADCVAEKFRVMGLHGDVQLRNTTCLMDYLNLHHQEIELLIYVDKRRDEEIEERSRMDYLQLLWTIMAKHAVPLMLLFFKYNSNYMIDTQLDDFVKWSGKQYRHPPLFYLFKLTELYGTEDKTSALDVFYRRIVQEGEASILRRSDGHGDLVERQLDYVYVKDVMRVLYWFATHHPENGVYELGSGFPRTDMAVANAIYRVLKQKQRPQYIDDSSVRGCPNWSILGADLTHLRRIGYKKPFYSLEKGVKSHIQRSFSSDS